MTLIFFHFWYWSVTILLLIMFYICQFLYDTSLDQGTTCLTWTYNSHLIGPPSILFYIAVRPYNISICWPLSLHFPILSHSLVHPLVHIHWSIRSLNILWLFLPMGLVTCSSLCLEYTDHCFNCFGLFVCLFLSSSPLLIFQRASLTL